MNFLKNPVTLFILVFLFSQEIFGQATYNLPPKPYYERATIGLSNFEQLDLNQIYIQTDFIQYVQAGDSIKIPFEDINYIRVKERTKAKEGALLGGSTMFVLSLLAVNSVVNDPNMELRDNAAGRVLLFILGGAVFGALIGSHVNKYTSYYIHVKPQNN
jgi:hypothetical protein